MTAAVIPPHRDGKWLIVIAFSITRPGTYRIRRAKIACTIGGHPGWQYQNLGPTIYGISTPAGARPQLDGCL